jgi:hypothetical protein
MIKLLFRLLVGFAAFSALTAVAYPPVQHRAEGTVQSFDLEKSILVLNATNKSDPTVFVVKAGRTRFRRDGKTAVPEQLTVGQTIQLYYRKELGKWVVTEILWKSVPTSKTQPSA